MGSPFDVEERLAELWRAASSDEQPVLRACSMNLVVVCADGDRELAETTELVDGSPRPSPVERWSSPRPGRTVPKGSTSTYPRTATVGPAEHRSAASR